MDLPDWYTPPPQAAAPVNPSTLPAAPGGAPPTSLPDWYAPPAGAGAPAPVAPPGVQAAPSATDTRGTSGILGNATELAQANVVGLPWTLNHFANWMQAKAQNATQGTNLTGADRDATDPIAQHLISPDEALADQAQTSGRLWYQPKSLAGELAQTALAAAPTGGANIPGIIKAASAGGAAELAHHVFPQSDLAPALAAFLTHAGMSTAQDIAQTGYNVVRPLVRPSLAGADDAGATIPPVAATGTGIANPSPADLTNAGANVAAATGAVGAGLTPSAAMGGMRDDLQTRLDGIKADASATAGPLYDAFRAENAVPPESIPATIASLPAMRPALKTAATDMQNSSNAGNPYGSPTTPYVAYNAAGDPVYQPGALTPDLLDRAKQTINDQAFGAKVAGATNKAAGLNSAAGTLTDWLDKQFPNTYAQARAAYGKAMEPAAPFQERAVGSVMARPPARFGYQPDYNVPDGEIFDRVAAAKDPGTVVKQFIDASGGNPADVTGPIQDALVGKLRAQGVIDPTTGQIDAKAYARAVQPYLPTMSMYLPGLQQKFGTALSAQNTLDTMNTQAKLAGDIANGGMRDSTGVITGKSIDQWTKQNREAINTSQGPAASLRLQAFSSALGGVPGKTAEAMANDALPSLVGYLAGGSEGGIFGDMLGHPAAQLLIAPRLAKYREEYSANIERAMVDPNYAKQIMDAAAKRPAGLTSVEAIKTAIGVNALRAALPVAASTALSSTTP